MLYKKIEFIFFSIFIKPPFQSISAWCRAVYQCLDIYIIIKYYKIIISQEYKLVTNSELATNSAGQSTVKTWEQSSVKEQTLAFTKTRLIQLWEDKQTLWKLKRNREFYYKLSYDVFIVYKTLHKREKKHS